MHKIITLKQILFLLLGIMMSMQCFTQNSFPYGVNYQAIARDENGNPLIKRDIVTKMQILQLDKNVLLWEELHYTTTNEFGLFQLIIGEGFSTEEGLVLNFESINWAMGPIGVKVYVNFGDDFLDMGKVKLQSVPYAFLADSALKAPIPDMKLEQINNVSGKKPTKNQPLIWDGNNWTPGDSLKVSNVITMGALKLGISEKVTGVVKDPEFSNVSHQTIPTSKAVKKYVDSTIVVQDLELIGGSTLRLTNNPSPTEINLAPYTGTNTDEQILSLDNTLLRITNGNTVNLEGLIDDEDPDPENEIQDLSFSNNILSISGHPSPTVVDLSTFLAEESDPVYLQSPAAGISQATINNWDGAFSWGDHSLVGYLIVETDPIFSSSVASAITSTNITNWNNAYSWGDHSLADYLTVETDPIFSSSVASGITSANMTNWNNAYSWGDHSLVGYLTVETDPIFSSSVASGITSANMTNWNNAYSWGDHSLVGYLTIETDPIFSSSAAAGISPGDISNWNNNTNYWSLSGSNLYVLNRHVGIGTSDPKASLHIADNDVVFSAPYSLPGTPGSPPIEGQGTRLMWYAEKAAFRVGSVQSDQWNQSNIGNNSFAYGINTIASGSSSFAGGSGTEASGNNSVAIGSYSNASANGSVALGSSARANNMGAVAIGNDAQANGEYSVALGFQIVASGRNSVALGINTRTYGTNYGATAMGFGSESNGTGATAMGYGSQAFGLGTTAMGDHTIASGPASIAMGNNTEAIGEYSTAMGNGTTTTGFNSLAANMYTTSQSYASSVFGRYNIIAGDSTSWINTDPLFVIGNGSSSSNRNNALIVYKNGNTTIDGNVTANAFFGDGSGLTGVGGTQCLQWDNSNRLLSITGCGGSYFISDEDDDANPTNELQNLQSVLSRGYSAGSYRITYLANPINNQDAATKSYVDQLESLVNTLEGRVSTLESTCCGSSGGGEVVVDADGNVYHTVNIGSQVWMGENLRTTRYKNGTAIPYVTNSSTWAGLTTPAYCWPQNNPVYAQPYGALYNWYVIETGNVCPTGWHVPTHANWLALLEHLGGKTIAGGKLKETGTIHWASPNTGATDEYGYSAVAPGGRQNTGTFENFKEYIDFWTPDIEGSGPIFWIIWNNSAGIDAYGDANRNYGTSIRCIKD